MIMDFDEGDVLQISRSLQGVTLDKPEDLSDYAIDLGEAGTLIDFGQGDSILLQGVSMDELSSDWGKYVSIV
jgi:hypothetical protein